MTFWTVVLAVFVGSAVFHCAEAITRLAIAVIGEVIVRLAKEL